MISSCFGKKLDTEMFRKSILDMAQVIEQLLTMNYSVFPYNSHNQSTRTTDPWKERSAAEVDISYIKQKGLSEAVRLCFGKILDKSGKYFKMALHFDIFLMIKALIL